MVGSGPHGSAGDNGAEDPETVYILLARSARRGWAEIVHQWRVQEYLQHRLLSTLP
ncbi:hypothetical protein [Calidifontibacter terrae]